MRIYRYELRNLANRVNLGRGAKVLSVAGHAGCVSLWAQVDPNEQVTEYHTFHVVGTGDLVPDEAKRFIGTAIVGVFVFHVFEEDSW